MIPALTFDDGPSEWTPAILDHLAAADRQGLFFVIGANIAGNENTLIRTIAEGHIVGVHSFTHPRLTGKDPLTVYDELVSTRNAIEAVTGVIPWLWRAPYLDTDRHVDGVAATLRLAHFGASVEPDDWMLSDPGEIVERVLHLWNPDSVVVLHDGIPPGGGSTHSAPTRQATVDALPHILAGIR